jgi:alpha-tubulin suppressor-like RCC1 family protein
MALRIQQILSGKEYSLVLISDGSVWATGVNVNGQLGDGTRTDKSTWTSVMASGVTQVAAGANHSLALKSDGAVWATGDNEDGQLGDGTTTQCSRWKSVIPAGVVQLSARNYHSLALKADGSVWATGGNWAGQFGDGTTTGKSTWTSVIASGVTQVAAGGYHSLVLKDDGSVWAAGRNDLGQLGNGTNTHKTMWFCVMPSGSDVIQVAAGSEHSLALKSDGSVWATGHNAYGQLGDITSADKKTWTCVMAAGSGVTQVAAGFLNSFALKCDGSVWATGCNTQGQFGDGTAANKSTWNSVIPSGVTQVAGGHHSLALKADGTLWKAGDNHYGQLGHTGDGSTVWIPDRFFEKILLESLLSESRSAPCMTADVVDDWYVPSL